MKFTVQKIAINQFDVVEQKIRDSHKSFSDIQESWASLDKFFHDAPPSQDWEFRWTYFRVYVDLTRKLFSSLDIETIVNTIFGRQVPMAILLDVDFVRELLSYLSVHAVLEQDMQNLYIRIKKAFAGSSSILGIWKNKEVTVAEIVKEFFSVKQRGDTMTFAEFSGKLKEIFSPKNDPIFQKYVLVNPDEAVRRFTELATFFFLMEPKDIWYAVDVFVNPKRGVTGNSVVANRPQPSVISVLKQESPKLTPPVPKIEPKPAATMIAPPQALVKPPLPKKELEVRVEKIRKMSFAEMKAQIDNQFKKDPNGQFINISEVLRELERLAAKFGDDRIRDLYIFSENDSKFEWNEKLMSE